MNCFWDLWQLAELCVRCKFRNEEFVPLPCPYFSPTDSTSVPLRIGGSQKQIFFFINDQFGILLWSGWNFIIFLISLWSKLIYSVWLKIKSYIYSYISSDLNSVKTWTMWRLFWQWHVPYIFIYFISSRSSNEVLLDLDFPRSRLMTKCEWIFEVAALQMWSSVSQYSLHRHLKSQSQLKTPLLSLPLETCLVSHPWSYCIYLLDL